MQCFRENPDLKIYELATMSGFNSIVSYNMAFRLFMGENPSEWCRKEKTRKITNKK
jgi:transcriptional regulator GlxA family with amidase domain